MATQEDPRILELRALRERAKLGGGSERIDRHHARGRLTAHERIRHLLDPGTFTEIQPFVVYQGDEMGDESVLGEGVVTGFGQIDGRTVYVYAQDFTVYGGTLSDMQSLKICRLMDLAAQSGAPIIALIDSGGARIQNGVRALNGYGELMKRNALYSGVVPQISLMLGPCAGGAAYSPALQDMIIMVEKNAYFFLTGPEVIKTVTGEVVDVETLGGTQVHLGVSGTAHIAVPNEQEAFAVCRRVLSYLPANSVENPPFIPNEDDPMRMDEVLNSIVPLEPTESYNMHTVIDHLVDAGTFVEVQPLFAPNCMIGLARIGGYSVGIVAQEPNYMAGVIDINASDKIARFVRFCDCFNLPVVTLVDSPGFLPGIDQEYRGIIRHGAKILYAYSEATVPKITVITRKAYGGAYVVMGSKSLGTDITLAWPSAEIAVMGAEGAVNIVHKSYLATVENPKKVRQQLIEEYREKFGKPYYVAGLGGVDDVIEPRETRPRIVAALSALRDKSPAGTLPRKHGNIPL